MKIRLIALVLTVILLTTALSGCSLLARLDAAEDAVEQRADQIEDAAEATLRQAVTNQPSEPSKEQVPAPDTVSGAAVTAADAEKIALEHAGVTAGQVTGLRAEYEIDDGAAHYDVRFRVDRWEYEYEIHAETGAVLSFEKDD